MFERRLLDKFITASGVFFTKHSHKGSALMFTSGMNNGIAMGEFEGEPLIHERLALKEYCALLDSNGLKIVEMMIEIPRA